MRCDVLERAVRMRLWMWGGRAGRRLEMDEKKSVG